MYAWLEESKFIDVEQASCGQLAADTLLKVACKQLICRAAFNKVGELERRLNLSKEKIAWADVRRLATRQGAILQCSVLGRCQQYRATF